MKRRVSSQGKLAAVNPKASRQLWPVCKAVVESLERRRLLADTVTIVASFDGANAGSAPFGNLLADGQGNLYGISSGTNSMEIIFELPSGSSQISNVASLPGQLFGDTLHQDGAGNFYAQVKSGDESISFLKLPAGSKTLQTIGTFDNSISGSDMAVDSAGDIYTVTADNDSDVIDELPAQSDSLLERTGFGYVLAGDLVTDNTGDLFGTTSDGGANGGSTVFELAAGSSTITTLTTFDPYDDVTNLTIDSAGDLYGITESDGAGGASTIFEIPHGSRDLVTLATFAGVEECPTGALALDQGGDVFGVIENANDSTGTLFEVAGGSSTISTLATFSGLPDGQPYYAGSGKFYVPTENGGANNDGSIVEIAPPPPPVPSAVGPELTLSPIAQTTQVNTQYNNDHSIARDAAGDFAAAWEYKQQVYVGEYDSFGTLIRDFQVGNPSVYSLDASVGMDTAGDFVVSYESQVTAGYQAYANVYNAQGNLITTDAVGDVTYGTASAVAMDASGDFVVAYYDDSDISPNDDAQIYAQRYSLQGQAEGGLLTVSDTFQENFGVVVQPQLSVAMDKAGDFAAAWMVQSPASQDASHPKYDWIGEVKYDAGSGTFDQRGRASSVSFVTAPNPDDAAVNASNASIAMDDEGDYVVAFQTSPIPSSSGLTSGTGIYAQRYAADGAPVGPDNGPILGQNFRVDDSTEEREDGTLVNHRFNPVVSMDAGGDFIITWSGDDTDDTLYANQGNADLQLEGVFAREFDVYGNNIPVQNVSAPSSGADEFLVNTQRYDRQYFSSVAMDSQGDFVIDYTSRYTVPIGSFGGYLEAQVFTAPNSTAHAPTSIQSFVDINGEDLTSGSIDDEPTALLATFNHPMDRSTVEDLSNWSLAGGTIDSIDYGLTGGYTAVLNLASPLLPGNYTISASSGILDAQGQPLTPDTVSFTVTQAAAPTIGFDQTSVNEQLRTDGGGEMQITIDRNGNLNSPSTVFYATQPGTADPSEYGAITTPAEVNFSAGQSSQIIFIGINQSFAGAAGGTFSIVLSDPSNANLDPSATTETVTLLPPAAGGGLIDVDFTDQTPVQSGSVALGSEVIGSDGDQWNDLDLSTPNQPSGFTSLNDTDGNSTGVSLSYAGDAGIQINNSPFNDPGSPNFGDANLMSAGLLADQGNSFEEQFSGLEANGYYNLYLYSSGDPSGSTTEDFSINGQAETLNTDPTQNVFQSGTNYLELDGIQADSDGNITIIIGSGSAEYVLNGMQLQSASPPPGPASIGISGLVNPVPAGSTLPITIQLFDSNNNPLTADNSTSLEVQVIDTSNGNAVVSDRTDTVINGELFETVSFPTAGDNYEVDVFDAADGIQASESVKATKQPDLSLSPITVVDPTGTFSAGDTVTVSFTETNASGSEIAAANGSWIDRLDLFDQGSGIAAQNYTLTGPIQPGDSVTRTLTFPLPTAIAGSTHSFSIGVFDDAYDYSASPPTRLDNNNAAAGYDAFAETPTFQIGQASIVPLDQLVNKSGTSNWNDPSSWSLGQIPDGNTDVNLGSDFSGSTLTLESGSFVAHSITSDASIVVDSGSLTLLNPSTIDGSLTIQTGGTVDLTSGSLTIKYGSAPNDPASPLVAAIKAAYDGGLWDNAGLTSSTASGLSGVGVGYLDDTVNHVFTAKYTFNSDYNLDGSVSSADFDVLAIHYGQTSSTFPAGDANFDGIVNALDFNALATNYGKPLPTHVIFTSGESIKASAIPPAAANKENLFGDAPISAEFDASVLNSDGSRI